MTSKTPPEHRDPRIERVILAAAQHGARSDADHEVGDLQDVLRSAWSLMTGEQRTQLMAAAETLNVMQEGDDYIEVAQLRGCLMKEDGLHRVLIEVTRDGGDSEPYITSIHVVGGDHHREVDWRATGADPSQLKRLARRLDDELLQAMPPQEVVPAWVSTIDWDLDRDVLTQSVRIEGVELDILASRWLSASEALDRHALPENIKPWQEERHVVMEFQASALGQASPRWAEITLNTSAVKQLRSGLSVDLGGPALPVRTGGAASGKLASSHVSEPTLEVVGFGQDLQLRGCNEQGYPINGARLPLRLFLQWVDTRTASEILFVSESGNLLNDTEGFARHFQWVDEYQRTLSPTFVEPETEFDGERPRG